MVLHFKIMFISCSIIKAYVGLNWNSHKMNDNFSLSLKCQIESLSGSVKYNVLQGEML